jgi:phosphopantothenoylcysteine decarboxylase / phosphopantothenate---cysteine ligase
MLQGKKILLGVTGSIAAYKAAILVRSLIKSGAEVKVVMTPDAAEFITPLTLSTLSKNPVYSHFKKDENGTWNNHVDLALWADIILIAPATANTLAKMANGICDNLLLAIYLSAKCKVIFAPAMDLDMYQHPAVINNIKKLEEFGNVFLPSQFGELASGLSGEGRMMEPEDIHRFLADFFLKKSKVTNKKIVITAGPTYEAIDPVRFIGNHSSGKMGIAIANELASKGADVTLICGPSTIKSIHSAIKRINVVSAEEMFEATTHAFKKSDIAILSAAVADFKPAKQEKNKIKKANTSLLIELEPTKDILAALGKVKNKKQILIGFALETNNELVHAKEKLKKKNLDFIVLNSLNDENAGFGVDTNKITIIEKNNKTTSFSLKSKDLVAKDIVAKLEELL